MIRTVPWLTVLSLVLFYTANPSPAGAADDAAKPKIAFFPLAGNGNEDLREKVGFSLRSKLDRDGAYDVIDGPKMAEISAESKEPISYETSEVALRELAKLADAQVLVWGDLSPGGGSSVVRLKLLDLRVKEPKVRTIEKTIKQPTDLRFVSEEILQAIPGVKAFEHPNEIAVQNDAAAEQLWKTGKNLMVNGDFSATGKWTAIYQAEKYEVKPSDTLPAMDKVNIYRWKDANREPSPVLAMNLSRFCAENNGMACLSDSIAIQPDTRYRIQFRYKSDGPTLHVFVKGYTSGEGIKGEKTEREIYRRQVPPSGPTNGKWVEVTDELNPQHVAFPVKYLRVDLYAYLSPGVVMFDDVVIKAVGKQTRKAKDEAIDKP